MPQILTDTQLHPTFNSLPNDGKVIIRAMLTALNDGVSGVEELDSITLARGRYAKPPLSPLQKSLRDYLKPSAEASRSDPIAKAYRKYLDDLAGPLMHEVKRDIQNLISTGTLSAEQFASYGGIFNANTTAGIPY